DREQVAVISALCQHPERVAFINLQHPVDGRTALATAVLRIQAQMRLNPDTVTAISPTVIAVNTLVTAGADPTLTCKLGDNGRVFHVLDYVAQKKLAPLLPGLSRAPVRSATTAAQVVPERPVASRSTAGGGHRVAPADSCCTVQ
ncbi:MAG TPA: hypothetical protein VJJ83_04775, partial [Candidatus Babeliales bacterium]|nr:hypothetical protein [Candidatus Babeliales bacterium]